MVQVTKSNTSEAAWDVTLQDSFLGTIFDCGGYLVYDGNGAGHIERSVLCEIAAEMRELEKELDYV
jgi:hypothetical protein